MSVPRQTAVTVIDKKTAELKVGDEVVELEIPYPQQNLEECNLGHPQIIFELEWVYGHRGRDTHKTMIFVQPTEELAYCCGTVVVLYHEASKRQRHYKQHSGIIYCMAVHPERPRGIIATGQEASKGKNMEPAVVHIWKAETLETLQTIGSNGEFYKGIVHINFSLEEICVVSLGNFHVLSVWNWKSGERNSNFYESENPIFYIEFNPILPKPLEMLSFGRGKLFSWILYTDGTLTPRLIETKLSKKKKETRKLDDNTEINETKSCYITWFTFAHDGDITIGDSEGFLHIIEEKDRTNVISMNSGSHAPIQTIQKLPHGRLITGHCDGWVALWDKVNTVCLVAFQVCDAYGSIRNVAGSLEGHVFASTTKNWILFVDSNSKLVPFVWGHSFEVNGLCSTSKSRFVTCGKDKRVIMWDALKNEAEWVSQIHYEARCAAVSASDTFVAVGCYTGHWVLLNAEMGHSFNEGRVCYDPIECIGFSPVDTFLAMGARSGEIYIFVVKQKDLTFQGKLKMRNGPTTHMDFSVDSYHLRTCSNDRKIYYWVIPKCKEDDSDYVKYDHYWWTKTCTTAYLCAGIWQNARDLSEVTCSSGAPSEKFLASGNDDGSINIFRYPCSSMKSEAVTQTRHGSKVNSLAFLKNIFRLISVGGSDCTIFQWKISLAPVNMTTQKN